MKTTARILTVIGFSIGSVACGGGGDGSSGASLDDFCAALEDIDQVQELDPTDDDDLTEIQDFIDELSDLAPDDLQAELATLSEAFEAIAENDTERLDDPDFDDDVTDAAETIERFASRECGIETDDTEASDDTEAAADTVNPDNTVGPDNTATDDTATDDTTAPSDTEAPPVRDGEAVVVTDAGIGFFQSYGETTGTWAALVSNPYPQIVAEYVELQATFRDSAGNVVGTDTGYISEILPGETRAVASDFLDDVSSTATVVDVVASTGSFRRLGDLENISLMFAGASLQDLGDDGVRVVAELSSSSSEVIESPGVTAVFRDATGTIIGGSYSYANFVPVGGSVGVEVRSSLLLPPGTTAELYADFTSYLVDDGSDAADLTVIESGFSTFDAFGSQQATWAATVSNPNADSAANYVTLVATFRDATGAVVRVDQGSITAVGPSAQAAYTNDYVYDLPAGAVSVEVVAHSSDFTTDLPPGTMTVGNVVTSVDDSGELTVVGEIASTFATNADYVQVNALFRDASGAIIGGSSTYLDFVPANSSIGFTIDSSIVRADALTTEIFLDFGDIYDS